VRKQRFAGAAALVLYACGLLAAQSQPNSENYRWHGELVSFDGNARAVTVKSMFGDRYAADEVTRFKVGDRVLVMWSATGIAIRRITEYGEGPKAGERFLLPVELVSTDTLNPTNQSHYLTFRVRVPDSSLGALKAMKPGEWITGTSAHSLSRDSDAMVSIRPYTAAPGGNTK
jgi:hypothetical protein